MSRALVTGASGGIGLAIAQVLARSGHNLLLVARSEEALQLQADRLSKEFGVKVDCLAMDLTKPGAIDTVVAWVNETGEPLDVLVNNAGYALWGRVDQVGADALENMLSLNVSVPAVLCVKLIPLLMRSQRAYILNVGSTTAYQAIPYLAAYAASKSFVMLFTRALRWELRNTPISVSCVNPGATSTGFIARANMEALRETAEKVSMSPEKVAEIAVRGMLAGKAEIVPGMINKISARLIGILPKNWSERIANGIYQHRPGQH